MFQDAGLLAYMQEIFLSSMFFQEPDSQKSNNVKGVTGLFSLKRKTIQASDLDWDHGTMTPERLFNGLFPLPFPTKNPQVVIWNTHTHTHQLSQNV